MKISVKSFLVASLVSMQVVAGGSTGFGPQTDAVVSCSGVDGEILFNVFKDKYKGTLLTMNDADQSHVIVRLTNRKLIRAAFDSGVLQDYAWDQTAFLKSIGVDISAYKDNIALFVETANKHTAMPVTNIQGGTLKTGFTAKHLVIRGEKAPYKQVAPKVDSFISVNVNQMNERTYRVNFRKIASGQKVCVREEMVRNPYFTVGADGPEFIKTCVEFEDISEQQTVVDFPAYLRIDQCRLLNPR